MSESGEQMPEQCNHDWVYSDRILTCNPPIHQRICRKCGKMENEISKSLEINEYDRIVEKFSRKEKFDKSG